MPRRRSRRRRNAKLSRTEREAIEHRRKASLPREFVRAQGWKELRAGTIVDDVKLFGWVHRRRQDYRKGQIADWLVDECEAVPGWSWDPIRDRQRRGVDALRKFVRKHGWDALTLDTRENGVVLSTWAAARRREYRRRVLTKWIVLALEAIPGWSWKARDDSYRENLLALRGHVARNGWNGFNLATTARDGTNVGKWRITSALCIDSASSLRG